VAAGLGWSVLPHLAVATARQRNGLEVIRLAPGLERTLAWVMRRDKPLNRALGAVREAVLGLQRATRVLG